MYASTLKLSIIRDSNQFSPIAGKKKCVLPINRTLFKRQIQLLFNNEKSELFCCCGRNLFVIWVVVSPNEIAIQRSNRHRFYSDHTCNSCNYNSCQEDVVPSDGEDVLDTSSHLSYVR